MRVSSSTRTSSLRHDYWSADTEIFTANPIRKCARTIPDIPARDDPDLLPYASRTTECKRQVVRGVASYTFFKYGSNGCASDPASNSQADRLCCIPAANHKRDYGGAYRVIGETITSKVEISTWSASVPKTTTTLDVKDIGYTTDSTLNYEVIATGSRFKNNLPQRLVSRNIDGKLVSLVEFEYPGFGTPVSGTFGSLQIPPTLLDEPDFDYYADCNVQLEHPPIDEKYATTYYHADDSGYSVFWSRMLADGSHSLTDLGYHGCDVVFDPVSKEVRYEDCPAGYLDLHINFPDSMFTLKTPETAVVSDCECQVDDGCTTGIQGSGRLRIQGFSSATNGIYISSEGSFFNDAYVPVQKGRFDKTLSFTSTTMHPMSKVSIGGCDASCEVQCEPSKSAVVFKGQVGQRISSNPYGSTDLHIPGAHLPWYYGLIGGTGGIIFIVIIAFVVVLLLK
jgi:hypothetical protein